MFTEYYDDFNVQLSKFIKYNPQIDIALVGGWNLFQSYENRYQYDELIGNYLFWDDNKGVVNFKEKHLNENDYFIYSSNSVDMQWRTLGNNILVLSTERYNDLEFFEYEIVNNSLKLTFDINDRNIVVLNKSDIPAELTGSWSIVSSRQ